MRPTRSDVLGDVSGKVHVMWQCHNQEMLIRSEADKALYFESVLIGLEHASAKNKVKLAAFSLMNNHVHQLMHYDEGSHHLSSYMRVAHGRFGLLYNRRHRRSGKVANERPKTSVVLDLESEMLAHFYIEANPVRAKLVKLNKLRNLKWNSYRFYAYGEIDEVTKYLSPPEWYLALGTTPEERQVRYRELFEKYLDKTVNNAASVTLEMGRRYIGDRELVRLREAALKEKRKSRLEARRRHLEAQLLLLGQRSSHGEDLNLTPDEPSRMLS